MCAGSEGSVIRPGRVVPSVSLQWDFTPSTVPAILVESLSLGAGGGGRQRGKSRHRTHGISAALQGKLYPFHR